MKHKVHKSGLLCDLRPVSLNDADFITKLRSNPNLSRYIHATDGGIDEQRTWLHAYFGRRGDYYFIVERKKDRQPVGTIGLYDVDRTQKTAEWGRWLVCGGSILAVESVLLLYEFAFDDLGLETVFCRTVSANKKIVSFHDSCGVPRTGLLKNYYALEGLSYDAVEHKLTCIELATVREKLSGVVQMMSTRQ